MQQDLELLAEIAKDRNVLVGCFLGRTEDYHIALGFNDEIQREDLGVYKFWTHVFYPDGREVKYLAARQQGEQRQEYPVPLQVPVDDEFYRVFYDLWAESPEDEFERSDRRKLVAAYWIAMDMRSID